MRTKKPNFDPTRHNGPRPDDRLSVISRRTLVKQLAVLSVALLISPAVFGVTFRFSVTSNRIYLETGGSATLSDIKTALPNAPLDLVDPVNMVWLLRANLFVTDGCTLVVHGTAIGGDANELRLQSNNSPDPGSFVSVTADWGSLDFKGIKITSWDSAVGGPDTEFLTFGRAFVRARSSLAADGITPLESRMDIVDSDVGYLGYDAAESYGLAWKVNGISPDPTKTIFDLVNVYGDIMNSHIHNNYFGTYSFGAFGSRYLNNELDHNAGYGFDPHDDSDSMVIEGNNVHHNGFEGRGHHGIIASRRCDHVVIRNNRSWANAGNGIMVHRHSNDALVENNLSYLNGDSGIAVFDSDRTQIRNNTVLSNSNAGMRFSVGSSDNLIEHNEVGYSGNYGFYLYQGDDIPEADDVDPTVTGRPQRNTFTNNFVHHSLALEVKLGDADDTTFASNTFGAGSNTLGFENATNNVLVANVLPAGAVVRLDGAPTNSTTMSLKNQPLVNLRLDLFSAATFEDDAGAIFDAVPGDLATTADTSGSFLPVTAAALGAQTATIAVTVTTLNFRVAPDSGAVSINPTLWELTGDLKKQWTTQPIDSPGSPTPQAAVITASVRYSVGDLAPNASYLVLRDGQPLSPVTSDSNGVVSFADVPGTVNPVQYSVVPNTQPPPLPTVTIAATDANASESGLDPGTFTISRTGDTSAALTVNYSLGGSAVNGADYQSLSLATTIPIGAASAIVTVTPIDDTAVEGNETVILTLSADAAYTVGSPGTATVTITDNDQASAMPAVTVAATDPNASEIGPDPGTFTISRTGDTSAALTVNYSLGGTAVNGADYAMLPGSVTIPAGASSVTVTVNPIDDTETEGIEKVILTLSPGPTYVVGSPNNATVTIAQSDQPQKTTVMVIATDRRASESGPDPGIFTIKRIGTTASALTVTYSLGGTAINGTDYGSLPGSITIPAGASSATVTVTPIDDTDAEGNETVVLTLTPNSAYAVDTAVDPTTGRHDSATVTILDNDRAGGVATVVAAGSSLAAGSVVTVGSVLGGTSISAVMTLAIATPLDGRATLAMGSIIAGGSTLTAGSELAGGTTVTGTTSLAGATTVDGSMMAGVGTTLAAGSVVAAGSIVNGAIVATDTILAAPTVVWAGGILAAGSTLAAGSQLAAGTIVL